MNQNIENMIRHELERMGIKTNEDDEQQAQDTPEQPQQGAPPRVPVEAVLSNAIGGPVALNNDAALGRIAGGPGATINGGSWGRLN